MILAASGMCTFLDFPMIDVQTNARFLHPNRTAYVSRLLTALPPSLDTFFFCNSGSEANDLALRIAKAYAKQEKYGSRRTAGCWSCDFWLSFTDRLCAGQGGFSPSFPKMLLCWTVLTMDIRKQWWTFPRTSGDR